ncbi:hypothetical protein [Rurimicrobium arvi]|uniref:Novel STAND NTPase 3 domain-containing protein n=1 Tax=Rurimicrobium arvi TaxID=2049916 RepID=A0ABP8MYI7_9BACT
MSVTKNGPTGYDYQYLVSLYMILLFSKTKAIDEIYIDKLDREDLALSLVNPKTGLKENFEFECKNKLSPLDKNYFIECVTKFTAKRDDEYILSKITSNQLQRFYLITSARAEAFAEEYRIILNNSKFEKPSYANQIAQKVAKEFKESILKRVKDGKAKKDAFIINHLSGLTIQEIINLMDKIFIADQLDEKFIYQRVSDLLTLFQITVVSHFIAIEELTGVIKSNRTNGVNILGEINRVLLSYRSRPPAQNTTYIPTGEENDLYNLLKKDKLLLLTGITLCGKTQMAYYIVNRLIEEWPSINYRPALNIREAEQFLFDYATEARVCYLEDPFGQYPDQIDSTAYKQFENLVSGLKGYPDRYLICTSNDVIVNKIKGAYLRGYIWHDQTILNRSFLHKVWRQLCKAVPNISLDNQKLINKAIEDLPDSDILQPGQLVHLAKDSGNIVAKTVDEIKHFATFKAIDITNRILSDETTVFLMQIFGIGVSTQRGLMNADLDYILDVTKDYLPGINQNLTRSIGSSLFGSNSIPKYKIREYEQPEALNKEARQTLSKVIDIGYINFTGTEYVFSHPIYQEGARNLLNGKNPIRFDAALNAFGKLIGCLNASVALQAVKNLYLLIRNCVNPKQHQRVVQLGILASQSTFVSVRDNSIIFLVNNYAYLNDAQREQLKVQFENRIDFGTENYYWQDGIAFIPDTESIETTWNRSIYFENKEALTLWAEYQVKMELPNAYQAFGLMKALIKATKGKKKRISYDIQALKPFLKFDEASIRERAAFLIAASITDKTVDELTSIYFENDPYVKFQLIKGLFRSWPYIKDNTQRNYLLAFMLKAFDEPFVVLSAVQLFTQFASGHAHAAFDWMYDIENSVERKMWYLWGELMIVLFKHLPSDVHINTGRFGGALYEAKVNIGTKVKIMHAYLDWLPGHLEGKNYNTNLSDTLHQFIYQNFNEISKQKRLVLIKRLFKIEIPIFQARTIRLFVCNWTSLSLQEQNYIIKQIPGLPEITKIVAYTSEDCPIEIQKACFNVISNDKSVEELIEILSEELILKILTSLYLYYPTKDMEGKDFESWNPVLKHYIGKTNSEGFKLAFLVFTEDIITWRTHRNGLWCHPKQIIRHIANEVDKNYIDIVFDILLLHLVGYHRSEAGIYLCFFVKMIPDVHHERLAEKLACYIEAISYHGNITGIPIELFSLGIKDKIHVDKMIIFMLDSNPFVRDNDDNWQIAFIKIVMMFIEHKEVRTHQALMLFSDWAKSNSSLFEQTQLDLIKRYESEFAEVVGIQEVEFSDIVEDFFRPYIVE